MDTLETTKNKEMEQHLNHQKEINDKLLHKYVIARTKNIPYEYIPILICAIIALGLGIAANLQFGMRWSVIVTVCSAFLLLALYKLIISLPLSKGNITMMNLQVLQHTLLQFKKRNIIGSICFMFIITASLVWLAFELRYIFTRRFLQFKIDESSGVFAFIVTIAFALIIALTFVYDIYTTSEDIDSIVEDINSLKID